jgi:hypothetical protein
MKLPRRRGHRQLATGLGVAAPTARASSRYGGPAGQHESGEGSPGRWRDGGVAERYQRGGVPTVEDGSRGQGQSGVSPMGR